tara:strand:+ start:50578 stop:51156 length:579 start_codon:yes stop_codon:yes gene_type:complete
MNTIPVVVGIDYSMTSPCICISDHTGLEFHYLTTMKKFEMCVEFDSVSITGHLMPPWIDDTNRFDVISEWAVRKVLGDWNKIDMVVLEDYSFASTGRTFQIGENFGLLKYKLRRSIIPFVTVPPTVLKKFATGKGNAKKDMMEQAFITETGHDIKARLGMTEKQWNPSSDVIDSYYLAKFWRSSLSEREVDV